MRAFFRGLLGTLQALVQVLQLVADRLVDRSTDALIERVQQLEASRALWEGEMQAAAVKIESRFNAARAAEERARPKRPRQRVDDEEADFGPDAEAAANELARVHAQGSGSGEVLTVRPALAGDPRATIRARKWGRA